MVITNINGTSDLQCKCGTWLKHWQRYSGQYLPVTCPVQNCGNKDLVGAHVQLGTQLTWDWYIVPLCNHHNQSSRKLEISDNIKPVSANKSKTCGY